MSVEADRIRAASPEVQRWIREQFVAGAALGKICKALREEHGVEVCATGLRRWLSEETEDRREAAKAAAADTAKQAVPLILRTLTALIEDGSELARRCKDGLPSSDGETRPQPRAWAEVSRAVTGACTALHAIVQDGASEPAALPLEQVVERVRAVYGLELSDDERSAVEAGDRGPPVH